MILKKCMIYLVAVSILLFSCTACANNNQRNSSRSASDMKANPTYIKKNLGTNLSIDADVDSQKGVKSIKVLKAKALIVGKQKLIDSLIKPAKIIKTIQRGTGDSESYEYDTADSMLVAGDKIDSGNFFETTFCKDYLPYLFCTDKTASWYSSNKYSKTSDLPFATRATAIAAIKKMLKSFGVDISQTYEGYSLDYKTMEKVYKLDKSNKDISVNLKGEHIKSKDNWSVDDDFYNFTFHPQFGKLMIDQNSYGSDAAYITGSSIDICYSKRGVIFYSPSFLYTQTGENSKDNKIIDVNAALKAVIKKFNSMILTDPTKITHVRLCYVASYVDSAHINYNLVPAWRFDGEQTSKVKSGSKATTSVADFSVIINAVTGKEM
jgi:hypothetical protein